MHPLIDDLLLDAGLSPRERPLGRFPDAGATGTIASAPSSQMGFERRTTEPNLLPGNADAPVSLPEFGARGSESLASPRGIEPLFPA